jgi:ATP-binding cassette subfamily F protein 3
MLMAQGLHKDFGSRELFHDLNWRIGPQDKVGLVGANGAGKTTLMRIIMGEEPVETGSVTLGQEETRGYLPQEVPRVAGGTAFERVLDGAREVRDLGLRLKDIEERMTVAPADAATALAEEHAQVLERYAMLDGYTLEGRAEDALRGLGFSHAQAHGPVKDLSGGWWMRVELARLLIAQPDYLLLDEPTNHLDTESLTWLEGFLQRYPGAWVVVSHDRYFLNRTVGAIAELSSDGMAVFSGDYDFYLEAKEALAAQLAQEAVQYKRKASELEAFISRFRAKASKAKQAQSRMKTLERMGPPPPAPKARPTLRITLPEPPRAGAQVAQLQDIHKAYGPKVLYRGLSLTLNRGDRVVVVGVNGAGKSTLLKMLAGVLPTDSGTCTLGHNVEPYYFAQHQLEMLNAKRTVLEEMEADWHGASPTQVRSLLGAFLFRGDALKQYVGVLSGGEKCRLALAKMMAKPANLLLLDEPTNHLDLASRDVLEAALAQYAGTIVCVSHDRYFINRIANRIWATEGEGRLTDHPGDYDAYQWRLAQLAAQKLAAEQADAPAKGTPSQQSASQMDFRAKKAQAKAQKQHQRLVESAEADIAAFEARIKEIDALLCDPQVFGDTARAKDLMHERQDIEEQRLPGRMAEWEALSEGG